MVSNLDRDEKFVKINRDELKSVTSNALDVAYAKSGEKDLIKLR